jgi:hypothetical protein
LRVCPKDAVRSLVGCPQASWRRPKAVRNKRGATGRLRRNVFMTLLADIALARSLPVRAQHVASPGFGFLCGEPRPDAAFLLRALRRSLREAGFVARTSTSNTLGQISCWLWQSVSVPQMRCSCGPRRRGDWIGRQQKSHSASVHSIERHDRKSNLSVPAGPVRC